MAQPTASNVESVGFLIWNRRASFVMCDPNEAMALVMVGCPGDGVRESQI